MGVLAIMKVFSPDPQQQGSTSVATGALQKHAQPYATGKGDAMGNNNRLKRLPEELVCLQTLLG